MDSVGRVGVLGKVMAIVRAVGEEPLDLAGLQRVTGQPRATAHRLALAMEAEHLLRRDQQGRFRLGFELIRLGRLATDAFPFAELARPVVAALRDRTGESAQLYVRDGAGRRCVVSLPSPHALRWTVAEGALLPMGAGSAGKVLHDSADAGAGRSERDPIDAVLVAESVEEREPGVASVSAAVTDASGAVVAAVGVSGPVERLTRNPRRMFGADVERAAVELTAVLMR